MIKQGLEIKQTQKLSPIQILTVKLIELPVQELDQRVQDEFDNNPVLEEQPSKDVSIDELESDDPTPSYRYKVNNWGKDERPEYNTFSVKESFSDSLVSQLGYRDLTEHQQAIGRFIIGSLDDDGYLKRDLDSLVDDLAFRAGIDTDYDEVESILHIVQEFDPAGVGARDLRECLLLQLDRMSQTEEVKLAIKLLEECYQEFISKHFTKICSRLDISKEELKVVVEKIVKLNPTPGGQVDDSYADHAQQVVPDFILDYDGRKLSFTMPRFNIPEVRVKKEYSEILQSAKNSNEKSVKEAAQFVKSKVDSAKWFVTALQQRYNTLSNTMQAILDFQYQFFLDGDESKLKPMVLKDIAEKTGYDISTISRVVNSKYIETHFGIFPLKYFFSEGLENQEGDEVSTRELKKALQECVNAEDKNKPLTDDQLVEEMKKRGYKVARRTIAKYRDQLGIPMARLRKEL